MPDDQPIAHRPDGSPIYDNAPSVVCVIFTTDNQNACLVRRANNPGKGLLSIPGGFQMRGETWQEAGAREVLEETGVRVDATSFSQPAIFTDQYGHNVIITVCAEASTDTPVPADGEATEIVLVGADNFAEFEDQFAFPLHKSAIYHIFHQE